MESLAGVVAHEIRASVIGVSSSAQLLRYAVPQDPVAERHLGKILQEAERLATIHEALTEYTTELPPRLVNGDPDRVLRDTAAAMRGALDASSAELRVADASGSATVLLDADQLGRAFERCLHFALSRVQSGTRLSVTSAIESRSWVSRLGADSPAPLARQESRASLHLALAHRTLVAHGGEVHELHDQGADLLEIRLPLASPE